MGLLKVIFIVLVIWYITKLIFRYVLPHFISRYVNRKMGWNDHKQSPPKEGEIHIKMDPSVKNQTDDKEFGDYVDFEEVKPEQKPDNE